MVRFTIESTFATSVKDVQKMSFPRITLTCLPAPLCSFNVLIMDGLSGYTQKMIPHDIEEKAFRIPKDNFHYTIMR